MIDKRKNIIKFNKKQKPSEKLELEIKRQEQELNLIKTLLNNKEIRDNEIKKYIEKKSNNSNKLNPIIKDNLTSKPRQNSVNPTKVSSGKREDKNNPIKSKEILVKQSNLTDKLTKPPRKEETKKMVSTKEIKTNKQGDNLYIKNINEDKLNMSISTNNIVKLNKQNECLDPINIKEEMTKMNLSTNQIQTGYKNQMFYEKEYPVIMENLVSNNNWLNNYNKLDDYIFRKSLTKKNEKVEINCNEISINEYNGEIIIKDELCVKENSLKDDNTINKQDEIEIKNLIKENDYCFIKDMLEEIKLLQYSTVFEEMEINNLEKLFKLEDKDLELFVPIGHRLKIFKKIKETKKLYELFLIKTEGISNENLNEDEDNHSLIINKSDLRHVSKKKNSLFNHLEEGIQVQTNLLPLNAIKSCCWNCLTLIDKSTEIISNLISDKQFCKSNCLNQYLEKYYAKCFDQDCSNFIEKEKEKEQDINLKNIIEIRNSSKDDNSNKIDSEVFSDSYDPMLDL